MSRQRVCVPHSDWPISSSAADCVLIVLFQLPVPGTMLDMYGGGAATHTITVSNSCPAELHTVKSELSGASVNMQHSHTCLSVLLYSSGAFIYAGPSPKSLCFLL